MNIDILWTCGKILVFTIVYFLGRMNFSYGWLLPLFFASIQDHFYYKRTVRKIATQNVLQLYEKDTIFSRLDEIPAWVLFPDYERSEWLNKIINQLWPRINGIVLSKVKDFEPILQQKPILRNFVFKKIDFGKVSPRITGIKVYDQNQLYVDEIILDMTICYFGDLELSFSLNGIEGGIKDIELEGSLRIVLKPVLSRLPMIAAVQIYFLKHPRTNFELTMGLASLDMFATGELIRSILKDQISLFMVYPNKIQIKLDKNSPSTAFVMPEIAGIVKVQIFSVDNIDGYETFLSVDLGQDFVETPALKISEKNAVEFKFARDLIAFKNGDGEVHLTLNKRDEDMKSTKIGTLSVNLQEIQENKCITGNFTLPSMEIISSKICFYTLNEGTGDLCVLQVYIDSGRNIRTKFTPFVELSVNDQIKKTSISKLEDEMAVWEKHFNFFITSTETDKLTVKIIDNSTFQNLGSYTYNIKDLMMRELNLHKLQAFPMNSPHNCEIVMALKLNFLKYSQ